METAVIWIVGWGVIATGSAAAAGILAGFKNRDYSFWIAWAFVLPPMLILLAVMPRHKGTRPRQPTLDESDLRD